MTTATAETQTTKHTRAASILTKSVVLVLHRHYLGNTRKVRTEAVIDAAEGKSDKVDSEQIKATKRLVDNEVLLPAMRILRDVMAGLHRRAVSAHDVFGPKTYLIAIANVAATDAWLEERLAELRAQAWLIGERYDDAKAAQQVKLGPLYDESEYPSKSDVVASFGFDWNYVSFEAPDRLRSLEGGLFESINNRCESQMAHAWDSVRMLLRQEALEAAKAAADKIAPTSDGRKRVFRGTVLDELKEFTASFGLRDLSDDAELGEAVARLDRLTAGLDGDALRDDDALRDRVHAELTAATDRLDSLVVAHRRSISLGGLGGEQ